MTSKNKKTKYTVEYFIKFFSKIPRNKWTTAAYSNDKGQYCALGHCGETRDLGGTPKSHALTRIFMSFHPHSTLGPAAYNDGLVGEGKHPKTRILNHLREIKKMQDNKDSK